MGSAEIFFVKQNGDNSRLFGVLTEPENSLMGSPRDTVYPWGKAHTSKRVSVIARDNVISKAKLCDAYTRIFRTLRENHNLIKFSPFLGLGTPRDTVYSWGEGANEQKTNKRKKEFVWSKQDLRHILRPFEFLAKPCSVAYDKYARSQELAKKRQNLIKILTF